MKIAMIYEKNSRGGIGERCLEVLKGDPSLEISQFNIWEIQSVDPCYDLYFRLDGDYGHSIPSTMHPLAWWLSDTHLKRPLQKILRNARSCDYVFCWQKEGAELLEKKYQRPVFWVPAASDAMPPDFKFKTDAEKKWDICFVGSDGKFSLRKVVLELIQEHYPNSFVGRAPYQELLNYYALSRIVINYPINNDINLRFFEAMGAGALLISKTIQGNGFSELFEPGKNLVTFDNIMNHELKQKIDYYLSHVAERETIARAGFDLVQKNYTFKQQLMKIFSIMGMPLQC